MPGPLESFSQNRWVAGIGAGTAAFNAVNGETVAFVGSDGLNFAQMGDYARTTGGPALRALTFHQRAKMLKAMAEAIIGRKEELYELSYATGATRTDSWIDIEGGSGTLHAYAAKGRRELPDGHILVDGEPEALSKRGSFIGQHIYTPLQGFALHINAFNFPVWGMLEKLAPTLLAGVPAIVKPASATAYLAQAAFRILMDAQILPQGAVQLVVGGVGDLFDHLTGQDVVSFTGSAATAQKLQSHPVIARESVRFVSERDSLNASILGPDAGPGTPEFDLFVREVVREMTTKAGQKCTAIRRAFVPHQMLAAAEAALKAQLAKVVVGDPRLPEVTMGALASLDQLRDVRAKVAQLAEESQVVFGDPNHVDAKGANGSGAFMSPILLRQDAPWKAQHVHDVEPFGPVATLMPYTDLADAVALANRGKGSLALSLFTYDSAIAQAFILGTAAFHGRIVIIDRDCARESTGHGSPLPMLVHGGPGRAGGGEELGGMRGVKHYMQRSALQGSPRILSAIVQKQLPGAPRQEAGVHPFRLRFGELSIGTTLHTGPRTITLADIEHFAQFTGDNFYAHMDEVAAAASPIFGGRVAHGYLVLAFAAGLFVDPAPGPVLANFGLENLRFTKPVKPDDSIKVALTVKEKSQRNPQNGEVKWHVEVINQDGDLVASYELLTLNAL